MPGDGVEAGESTMDVTSNGTRPSLETLKNLDAIPTLAARLEEAQRLCTHAFRAEMIVKWLLGWLKVSADVRSSTKAWNLLLRARLATLLVAHDLLSYIATSQDETHASTDLLAEHLSLLRFLLEVSDGPHGTPVKAALSVRPEFAALFLGAWLRHVQQIAASDDLRSFSLEQEGVLQSALEIWKLRNSGGPELFPRHCLVPAALLLDSECFRGPGSSLKRKMHNESAVHQPDDRKLLDTLVAKQIFARAREVYLKNEAVRSSGNEETTEDSGPGHTLRSYLKPLGRSHPQVTPQLLDTALRCSSTAPKKDSAWFEVVLRALLDCNCDDNGKVIDFSVLAKLLSTFRQRATLSRSAVNELFRRLTGIMEGAPDAQSSGELFDYWKAVAEFVAMDADVFADERVAQQTFASISESVERFQSRISHRAVPQKSSNLREGTEGDLQVLWREKIVLPIMGAFAKRRDLGTFIQIWSDHLDRSRTNSSGWLSVGSSFSGMVKNEVPEDEIFGLISKRFGDLKRKLRGAWTEQPIEFAESDFVVANALLAGATTPSVLQRLQPMLGESLSSLFGFLDSQGDAKADAKPCREGSFWDMLRRVFETWWPAWTVEQSRPNEVSEKAVALMGSSTVEAAFGIIKLNGTQKDTSQTPADLIIKAGAFVAALCTKFFPLFRSTPSALHVDVLKAAQGLVDGLGTAVTPVLVLYPEIVHMLDVNERSKCLSNCLDAVAAKDASASSDDMALQVLHSTVRGAEPHKQSDLIHELAELAMDYLKPDSTEMDRTALAQRSTALKLLHDLPVRSISRPQREAIIDAVSQLQTRTPPVDPQNQSLRLSLLVRLMSVANATCNLSTDPDAIWRIARSLATSIQEDVELSAFVDEMANRMLDHLVVTQDQERSQKMLLAISTEVKRHVENMRQMENFDASTWALPLLGIFVGRLEAVSKAGLKEQLVHRDSRIFGPFLELVCEHTLASANRDQEAAISVTRNDWLIPALYTLLSVPQHLAPASIMKKVDLSRYKAIENTIHAPSDVGAEAQHTDKDASHTAKYQHIHAVLVGYFSVGCRCGSADGGAQYARLACKIASLPLHPTLHRQLFEVFGHFVGRLDALQRIDLVESLLADIEAGSVSTVRLLEKCFASVDESMIEDDSGQRLRTSICRLFSTYATTRPSLRKALAAVITTILKHKSFLTYQLTVEATLASMTMILQTRDSPSSISPEIDIMSILLLQHRARLRGRCQHVIQVFQLMVSALFVKQSVRSPTKLPSKVLVLQNASRVARLLTMFCEPSHTQWKSKTPSLVDESRKEQAYVGEHVQYVLHHYCQQVLATTPVEGVRDALKPGLWSVIEAIEMNDAEGVKALSAAMNNSERAVLRGVYEDWRRFGKWRGG
ncbi:uncharacterized protein LTR77_004988 [Saxophila tyrrhenica]|uniref:Nucleolar 27S pre-rRNA processing Urb2/Npa2 C-terminal domain-containing protein n=1 Tax=Saxophila tyrrhenica TaxID=1690608 RepID=A0AAV9PBM4_9PEZI|nr:hypothetical protein LTR77_004988 [Saxophila tyrrhenica]